MKNIILGLLFLDSISAFAANVVCVGDHEKNHGGLLGGIYYSVHCTDLSEEHFSDLGCYSKSSQKEFLKNTQEELAQKGIQLIASRTTDRRNKIDFYIKGVATPEMKNHFGVLYRTFNSGEENLSLYLNRYKVEQKNENVRIDDYRNSASLIRDQRCTYLGFTQSLHKSYPNYRKDLLFLICK